MKDLAQWLVGRLQTVKQADAVVAGALPALATAGIDAIEASRHIPFTRNNPLLSGIRHHYSAGEGVRDMGAGLGRAMSEGARTVLPFVGGHGGGPSIGDNLSNHGGRAFAGTLFGAPAQALGTLAGGGSALDAGKAYTKHLGDAWQPFTGKGMFPGQADRPLQGFGAMFAEPWNRAMRDPEGLPRAGREMSGLLNRWQPKMLMGDTITGRATNVAPFWRNYLGVGNGSWNRPVTQSWQDQTRGITNLGKKTRPEVARFTEAF